MTNEAKTVDQFVELAQRLMRLRPKLVFQDESVARIKKQMKELKESGAGGHEDRIFLFRILDMLIHSETPPTMGELSAQLGIPLSSATRMADGLVRAKFAARCDDPNDRRIVRLCVTDTGRQFIEMATSFMKERITHLINRFTSEEQAQLLRLMNKLIDSIEAERS
jgi:DNA-binding MarR family transcriptional regulator